MFWRDAEFESQMENSIFWLPFLWFSSVLQAKLNYIMTDSFQISICQSSNYLMLYSLGLWCCKITNVNTYICTHMQTYTISYMKQSNSWENVIQVTEKFTALYATQKFIIMFTRGCFETWPSSCKIMTFFALSLQVLALGSHFLLVM